MRKVAASTSSLHEPVALFDNQFLLCSTWNPAREDTVTTMVNAFDWLVANEPAFRKCASNEIHT